MPADGYAHFPVAGDGSEETGAGDSDGAGLGAPLAVAGALHVAGAEGAGCAPGDEVAQAARLNAEPRSAVPMSVRYAFMLIETHPDRGAVASKPPPE